MRGGKTQVAKVRVSPETLALWHEAASADGVSLSAWLTRLATLELARQLAGAGLSSEEFAAEVRATVAGRRG